MEGDNSSTYISATLFSCSDGSKATGKVYLDSKIKHLNGLINLGLTDLGRMQVVIPFF